MDQGQPSFNFAGFAKDQLGGVVNKVNPDGSAQVALPDGSVQQFNTTKFLQDQGMDPVKTQVQYNTPETALNENPIGFMDGLKMATADQKGQDTMMVDKYGKENVMRDKSGQLLVNDKGAWKKADPGFLASLASSSPEIAAGFAGTEAGAAAGTVIAGPIGTFAGGIIGGATAAALATIVKYKGAEALNLRSEMDAKQAAELFGHETVNNLIWGTALMGTGKVLGMAMKPGKAMVQGVMQAVDKEGLAAMGEKLLSGTSKTDWSTVVRSAEDAQAVSKGIDQMAAYGKTSAEQVAKGMDPMTKGITSTIQGFMDDSKVAAQKMYGDMWTSLDQAGITKAPVQVADSATQLKSDMIGMGLLEKDAEGTLRFNGKPQSEDAERILQVFDPKSRNTIKAVFDQVTNVAKDGGEISFAKAKMLMGGVDDILENSGFYKNGENALSNNVRRSLSKFREGLSNNLMEGLEGKTVNGQDAQELFSNVNSKYSQYRSVMNDFSMSSKFGGDLTQMSNTAERMMGPKGFGLEDQFMKLGAAVGKDAEPTLQSLQQMRAAKNLSSIYTPNQGIPSLAREVISGGPRTWGKRVAQATIDQETFTKQWNESLMSKIPAQGTSKALVESRAAMVNFVNSMSFDNKMKLVTNPQALRAMVGAVESVPQMQSSMAGQMMQSVNKVANPDQGQGNGQ